MSENPTGQINPILHPFPQSLLPLSKVTLAGNHWLVSPDFVEYVEYPGLWFPHQLSVDTDGWLSQGRLASARAEIKSWEIPPSATTCVITPHSGRLCQGKVVPGAEESPQGDKRSNQRCTSRTTQLGEEQTALHSIWQHYHSSPILSGNNLLLI